MTDVTVINTIGTSPMVASEMVEYLVRRFSGTEKRISKFYLVYTKELEIIAGVKALIGAIKNRYDWIWIEPLELNMKDISRIDDFIYLLEQIKPSFVSAKKNGEKIYFNITGGRKLESVLISSYSPLLGIDSLFNITNTEIKNINELYERYKDIIMEFYELPMEPRNNFYELKDLYYKNKEKLEPIFFPDFHNIEINELKVLHIPRDIISEILMLIESDYKSKEDLEENYHIPDYRLKAYEESGLIYLDTKGCYRTELGKVMLGFIRY